MTYALATGIWRHTAAYRGTQDGSQHRKRNPGGTSYWQGAVHHWRAVYADLGRGWEENDFRGGHLGARGALCAAAK